LRRIAEQNREAVPNPSFRKKAIGEGDSLRGQMNEKRK